MDPNEALKKIRQAIVAFQQSSNTFRQVNDGTLDSLIDHVDALDGWLTHGGFLPDEWQSLDRDNAQARLPLFP